MCAALRAIVHRELAGAFATPVASLYLAAFTAAAGLLAFQLGGILESGRADLAPFFQFHAWLFVVFAPALAMLTWVDELRAGTLETLLALPVPIGVQVLAKFLAGWVLAGLALLVTVPVWIAVAVIGPVDHGAVLVGYLGSFLMAGALLALAGAFSAATSSQVGAFVGALLAGFLLTSAGLPVVTETVRGLFGPGAGEAVALVSVLDHLEGFHRGVIEARSLVYFLSFIALCLLATAALVEQRRAGKLR